MEGGRAGGRQRPEPACMQQGEQCQEAPGRGSEMNPGADVVRWWQRELFKPMLHHPHPPIQLVLLQIIVRRPSWMHACPQPARNVDPAGPPWPVAVTRARAGQAGRGTAHRPAGRGQQRGSGRQAVADRTEDGERRTTSASRRGVRTLARPS